MAVPSITDLKMWVGTLFTKDDWDFNFSKIVEWLSGGSGDLVVNSIKATNGLDMDGGQISNLGAATTGSQAVTLDQAQTLLNRTSYYYPFSVASGKVDSNGKAAYLQKDSDTQVTVLAGNVNPDLVCIMTDGTIESVTSNTVLTVQSSDGTYHIIKEKEQAITITSGASGKVTVGQAYPTAPNIGDYFCDNSVVPFKGYKYTSNGWEATEFCWLGDVTVESGTATVNQFPYNNNNFDMVSVESYINGYAWYNVYANGWCEQGGLAHQETDNITINLHINYKDTNYSIVLTGEDNHSASVGFYAPMSVSTNKTVSQFKCTSGNGSSTMYTYWRTSGYIR